MSNVPFVRQLGYESGVQLNPLIDETDSAPVGITDQVFAVIGRMTRGPVDHPFVVDRSNFFAKTGPAASIRTSALNEAKLQTYEALRAGAYQAIVQRLVGAGSVQSYAVIKFGTGATFAATFAPGAEGPTEIAGITVLTGGTGYTTGQELEIVGEGGTGARATIVATAGVVTGATIIDGGDGYPLTGTVIRAAESISYSVSESVPVSYSMYLAHAGCYNDGIKISIHADASPLGGTPAATKLIKLRILDVVTGDALVDVSGSLDPVAVDDYGNSIFLPDIMSAATGGEYTLSVAANATMPVDSGAYGRTASGAERWNTSDALILFTEGSLSYTDADYDAAITKLTGSTHQFGYLLAGGTQSISFIGKLAALATELNVIMLADISGRLTPTAAIAFAASLGLDNRLVHLYYSPIEAVDPMNGYREVWGTSGLNLGLRCARNAQRNAKGFAPKNYPIAGRYHPISRQGLRQITPLRNYDLSDLARAKINPACFVIFAGGGRYVWADSLTSAQTEVSYSKLISVAEMSSTVDNEVAGYARELVQLPMTEAIARMDAFLDRYLGDAETSVWLVPSQNLDGNAAYRYEIVRNAARPADVLNVTYWCSYDGVARQIILQQRLVK